MSEILQEVEEVGGEDVVDETVGSEVVEEGNVTEEVSESVVAGTDVSSEKIGQVELKDLAYDRGYDYGWFMDEMFVSHLAVLPKDSLGEPIVIGSYEYEVMAQDVIPVTIAFTMELHGEGLLYVDVDGYYKMNYPLEGLVYSSEEVMTVKGYSDEAMMTANYIQDNERVDGDYLNLVQLDGEMLMKFKVKNRAEGRYEFEL